MDVIISNPNYYTYTDEGRTVLRATGDPRQDCRYSYNYPKNYQYGNKCHLFQLRCKVNSRIIANQVNKDWNTMAKTTWTNTARHRFKTM